MRPFEIQMLRRGTGDDLRPSLDEEHNEGHIGGFDHVVEDRVDPIPRQMTSAHLSLNAGLNGVGDLVCGLTHLAQPELVRPGSLVQRPHSEQDQQADPGKQRQADDRQGRPLTPIRAGLPDGPLLSVETSTQRTVIGGIHATPGSGSSPVASAVATVEAA